MKTTMDNPMALKNISQIVNLTTPIDQLCRQDSKMGRMNATDIFATARRAAEELGLANPSDFTEARTLNRAMKASIEAAHNEIRGSMMPPTPSACLADIELQLIAISDPNTNIDNQHTGMDNIRWYLGQPGFIKPEVADVAKKSLQWVIESRICPVYLRERYSPMLK